jgi:hypothetical protein
VVWLVQSTGPDDTFASVQGAYREVAPRARQARVALLIAIVPSSIAFPWEGQFGTAIYERNPAFPAVRPVELPAISTRDVRNLYPNFRAVERRSHEPLFGASDGLLTAAGRAVTAGAIAEGSADVQVKPLQVGVLAFAVSLCALEVSGAKGASPVPVPIAAPILAGSGAVGMQDGPGLRASFVFSCRTRGWLAWGDLHR